ncbi:hypothetical protein QZH41_012996 [Actinostola sp. cb2023]|nr:hypothetical protein QZH41_012996 [Actinostola sp. cb2023]
MFISTTTVFFRLSSPERETPYMPPCSKVEKSCSCSFLYFNLLYTCDWTGCILNIQHCKKLCSFWFCNVVTTVVVIWRFLGEKGESYSWEKEKRACTVIGVCFIISAIGIFVRAARSLVVQRHPHEFVGIQIISGVSLVTYSILTWSKLVVAERISSSSLKIDGYNSFAGAILALGMLMSSLAYTWNQSIWFLDASIALCISVLLGTYGIR